VDRGIVGRKSDGSKEAAGGHSHRSAAQGPGVQMPFDVACLAHNCPVGQSRFVSQTLAGMQCLLAASQV
jgi:hypothetical protein